MAQDHYHGLCIGGPKAGLSLAGERATVRLAIGSVADFEYRHVSLPIMSDGYIIDRVELWVPAEVEGGEDPRVWALKQMAAAYEKAAFLERGS